MRALGLIPARGGSKGVPHKNITLLNGVPLLVYTARAAQNAQLLDHTIISTDDPEIAEVARQAGIDVPFMRPAELARDDTPTLPVIFHAIEALEQSGEHYDYLALLQPTAPLRSSEDIDNCLRLLEEKEADSVVSLSEIPDTHHPEWQFVIDDGLVTRYSGGNLSTIPPRRQGLAPTYTRNGAVYVVRIQSLFEQQSLLGRKTVAYIMPEERSVNIDSKRDLYFAEYYLNQKGFD